MSTRSAFDGLHAATSALDSAVAGLTMTTVEDRPVGAELAVVDRLAATVAEVQSSVVLAGQRIAEVLDMGTLPMHLGAIDAAIGASAITFWRDLRSFDAINDLRRATAKRDVEWRAWQQSFELSLLRCEQPLLDATAAVAAAWREIADLLTKGPNLPGQADVSYTTQG